MSFLKLICKKGAKHFFVDSIYPDIFPNIKPALECSFDCEITNGRAGFHPEIFRRTVDTLANFTLIDTLPYFVELFEGDSRHDAPLVASHGE